MIIKAIINGFIGIAALLTVYFAVSGLISGWEFATSQFVALWYFIVSLAIGFGIQLGLYSYLKNIVLDQAPKGVMAVSGTTSTIAMISCCAHYLANLVPIIGLSGAIALVGQYQIELFWLGLLSNVLGIGYIGSRLIKFKLSKQ